MTKGNNHLVYQFEISLIDIEPRIWRRIQVPAKYNFWDLHVAIQDSMGWLDYHLHVFRIRQKHKKKPVQIGIPDDEWDGDVVVEPGWEIPITDYFTEPGQTMEYEYDFGDGWEHTILLEAILLKEKGISYPRCIGGESACPPEDCGGIPGYFRHLEILRDPADDEYEQHIEWLEGITRNNHPYDPERFDPEKVHFDNPKRRWRIAFSEER